MFGDAPNTQAYLNPRNGLPAQCEAAGIRWIPTPTYPDFFSISAPFVGDPPPDDFFHPQISMLRDAGCEILTANMTPFELAVFLDQAAAEGFAPKVATVARALLSRADIEMLGTRADGLTTEIWWAPNFPYRSSLTGQTARELAEAYAAATGRHWTMHLGVKHAMFEVIVDVIRRTADLDDPAAVVHAIATTKLDTIAGPIEWTGKPVKNVAKTPVVTGQWRKEPDGFKLAIVDNTTAPDIPTDGELRLLS